LFVVEFALACCEINQLFVDVAVTLYFLQLSRADKGKTCDVTMTMASL
jgi:hypothetical protein